MNMFYVCEPQTMLKDTCDMATVSSDESLSLEGQRDIQQVWQRSPLKYIIGMYLPFTAIVKWHG